jgi:hypothetical protein
VALVYTVHGTRASSTRGSSRVQRRDDGEVLGWMLVASNISRRSVHVLFMILSLVSTPYGAVLASHLICRSPGS